ncbi:MAG: hypothetical protein FWD28_04475 [Treponema sp.]|nr:hypothetical protein [Treponema sp.]
MKTAIKAAISSLLAFIILSCATAPNEYREVDTAAGQADFTSAVEAIRRGQNRRRALYPERNAVQLFLDKGLLEFYAGNYEASSADLQNAERLIEEAYTKSITEGFFTYILNDNSRQYPGEDFENIYLNIFNALNYYNRGDLEGALVEIRKLSQTGGKLDMLARRYEYTDPSTGASLQDSLQRETGISQLPDTKSVNFSNSALARYLGALFYQAEGNLDSARIEFNQVHRAFRTNSSIYRHNVPNAVEEARNVTAQTARLNVICFTGLSPIKQEQLVMHYLPFRHPVLAISAFKLPVLTRRPSLITKIEVIVQGEDGFYLELLEDMGLVIEETYNARFSSILLKTYIRTIIKYAVADIAASEAARQGGELSGLLIALAARTALDASERADTRMSRFIPNRAYIGGINLDPGTYSVIINYYQGDNILSFDSFPDVVVDSGRLNLLNAVNLR